MEDHVGFAFQRPHYDGFDCQRGHFRLVLTFKVTTFKGNIALSCSRYITSVSGLVTETHLHVVVCIFI